MPPTLSPTSSPSSSTTSRLRYYLPLVVLAIVLTQVVLWLAEEEAVSSQQQQQLQPGTDRPGVIAINPDNFHWIREAEQARRIEQDLLLAPPNALGTIINNATDNADDDRLAAGDAPSTAPASSRRPSKVSPNSSKTSDKPWRSIVFEDHILDPHARVNKTALPLGSIVSASSSWCSERLADPRPLPIQQLQAALDQLPESSRSSTAYARSLVRDTSSLPKAPILIASGTGRQDVLDGRRWREYVLAEAKQCRSREYASIDCDLRCPIACRWSFVASERERADAIHVDRVSDTITHELPGQLRVATLLGPVGSFERDPAVMQHVALVAHWHPSAHMHATIHEDAMFDAGSHVYTQLGHTHNYREHMTHLTCSPAAASEQLDGAFAIVWLRGSKCIAAWAHSYLEQLREYVHLAVAAGDHAAISCPLINRVLDDPFDELASVASLPDTGATGQRHTNVTSIERATRIATASKYRFCLVFERERREHYVSDQVYEALAAGCVPVVFGPPAVSLAEYLPCTKCAVNGNQFSSPRELAQFLVWLDNNEAEYRRYLEYKHHDPIVQSWMLVSQRFLPCAICQHVAELKYQRNELLKPLVWSTQSMQWEPIEK